MIIGVGLMGGLLHSQSWTYVPGVLLLFPICLFRLRASSLAPKSAERDGPVADACSAESVRVFREDEDVGMVNRRGVVDGAVRTGVGRADLL